MCKSELPERDIISEELTACTDIAAEADEGILTDEVSPSEKRARGRGRLFLCPYAPKRYSSPSSSSCSWRGYSG